jgi:hypothetical protein
MSARPPIDQDFCDNPVVDLERGAAWRATAGLLPAVLLLLPSALAPRSASAQTGVEAAAGPTLELPVTGFGCSGAGYGGELRAGGNLGPLVVGGRFGVLGWGAPTACHTTFGQSRANDGILLDRSWGLRFQAFAAEPLLRREQVSLVLIGAVGARRVTYDFDPAIQAVAVRWLPEAELSSRLGFGIAGAWTVGAELGLTGLVDLDRGPNSEFGPPLSRFGLAVDAFAFASATF